jgi:hypothetical protein
MNIKKLLNILLKGCDEPFLITLWKFSLNFQAAKRQRKKTPARNKKTPPTLGMIGTRKEITTNSQTGSQFICFRLAATPSGVKKNIAGPNMAVRK